MILGTGSCGLAVIGGRRVTVGGYGAEVSDEAGGHRLGREALRRALWAFDGRAETTALSTAILKRFEWDPAKIVCFAARANPADYAEFAPLVFEYAAAKDSLAVAIVKKQRRLPRALLNGSRMSAVPHQSSWRTCGAFDEMAAYSRSTPFVCGTQRFFGWRNPHGPSCFV